jgi:hypothetical protein
VSIPLRLLAKKTKKQMIASFSYAFDRKVDVVDSVPGCNESASPHLD